MPSKRLNLLNAVALLLLSLTQHVAADDPVRFRSGKEFEKALSETIRLSSISIPLQSQLNDLTQSSGLAIHRDRRIDPRSPISLETDFIPRIQVLFRISQSIPESSICVHENVVLLGPTAQIHRVPVLAEQARKAVMEVVRHQRIPASTAAKKFAPSWEQLAEPRKLLIDATRSAGLEIENPDMIPHDVWAKGSLSSMTLADFAAIVLNEFDLVLKADSKGSRLQIQHATDDDTISHRYVIGSDERSAVESEQSTQYPGFKVRWTPSSAELTGTLDQHAVFHALIASNGISKSEATRVSQKPQRSLKKMAFQLQEGRMTAGQLIDNLRRQNLQIEVTNAQTPEVKRILDQIIRIDAMPKPLPGTQFFQSLFGELFQVLVEDNRVILNPKPGR